MQEELNFTRVTVLVVLLLIVCGILIVGLSSDAGLTELLMAVFKWLQRQMTIGAQNTNRLS